MPNHEPPPEPALARDRPLGRVPAFSAELARITKALGHRHRVRVLDALARDGEMPFGDLARLLKIAPSTLAGHLKILAAAGLVQPSGRRPECRYDANQRTLSRLKLLLGQLGRESARPPK